MEHQLGAQGRPAAATAGGGAGGGSQGGEPWARLGWLPRALINCWRSSRAWKHRPSRNRGAGAQRLCICAVRREDPVTRRGAKAPPAGPHRPLSQRRLKLGTMAEVRTAAAADSALHAPCCHQRRCLCLPRYCAPRTQQPMHCAVQLPPAPDAAAHMLLRPAPPVALPCRPGGPVARNMLAGMVAIAGQPLLEVLGGGAHPPAAAAPAGLTAPHLGPVSCRLSLSAASSSVRVLAACQAAAATPFVAACCCCILFVPSARRARLICFLLPAALPRRPQGLGDLHRRAPGPQRRCAAVLQPVSGQAGESSWLEFTAPSRPKSASACCLLRPSAIPLYPLLCSCPCLRPPLQRQDRHGLAAGQLRGWHHGLPQARPARALPLRPGAALRSTVRFKPAAPGP